MFLFCRIKSSQTGDQSYSDTSPHKVPKWLYSDSKVSSTAARTTSFKNKIVNAKIDASFDWVCILAVALETHNHWLNQTTDNLSHIK